MTTATPIKLKNGEWGAKAKGTTHKGEVIQVTTRAGKTWTSVVDQVIWSDGKYSIVATKKKSSTCHVASRRYKRESGYCYYPCPVTGLVCSPENGPCHDCI